MTRFLICLIFILLHNTYKLSSQEAETIFDRNVVIHEDLKEVPIVPRWERELGIKGQYILAGDVNLWVEEDGSGMPLVLVCGGPGTSAHYFHPHFVEAGKFSKVIYYDLRGVGLSDYDKERVFLLVKQPMISNS